MFKVGDRVAFTGYDRHYITPGDLGHVVGFGRDSLVLVAWDSPVNGYDRCWVDQKNLILISKTQEPPKFSLENTKIDVQKYADQYYMTLRQAHEEIQPWLFEQGYFWDCDRDGKKDRRVWCPGAPKYLFLDSLRRHHLTISSDDDHFESHQNKEIIIQRSSTLTLTPSFVQREEELVEVMGKKYNKVALEAALSKLE